MQASFYVFLCALAFCVSEKTPKFAKESSEDAEKVIVPTREWQTIKEGQKIPKGLHVRINLESGLKEVKILNRNTKKITNTVVEVGEPISAQNLNSAGSLKFIELAQTLKSLKNNEVTKIVIRSDNFKSFKELERDLGDLDLASKTDAEILRDLLETHKKIINDSNEIPQILGILDDLVYLVDQYDNAVDFINLMGFEDVILTNLNSSNSEIKQETLRIFGTAMQNNQKVQLHALEKGSIGILLQILTLDPDFGVKNVAVFALGALLRNFPPALLYFVENGGPSVFKKVLQTSTNVKNQIKIVTLIDDLILEHATIISDHHSQKFDQYHNWIVIKEIMNENDWCGNLNNVLLAVFQADPLDYDSIKTCFTAIFRVLHTCNRSNITTMKLIINKLQKFYDEITDNKDYEGLINFADFYYLLSLCRQIKDYSLPEIKKTEL